LTLHIGSGYCIGEGKSKIWTALEQIDGGWTWETCWDACLDEYSDGRELVSVDGPDYGACYCTDACPNLAECGAYSSMTRATFDMQSVPCPGSFVVANGNHISCISYVVCACMRA